jgi:predicted nucleic acid-binding protein
MLDGLEYVGIDDRLLGSAIRISPPTVRTLDAIHLASALSLGDALGSFVTYDRRMREAGIAMGLPVASPE